MSDKRRDWRVDPPTMRDEYFEWAFWNWVHLPFHHGGDYDYDGISAVCRKEAVRRKMRVEMKQYDSGSGFETAVCLHRMDGELFHGEGIDENMAILRACYEAWL